METALKYANITDKAYGLVGMAISLFVWDAENWLEDINIDAEPEEAMHMSPEYYTCYAPKVEAKAVWEQSFKRFQLIAAMTVANVTCRDLTLRKLSVIRPTANTELHRFLTEEGSNLCDLESDEVDRIYRKILNYCQQLFTHPGVKSVVVKLSDSLQRRRKMNATDIFEELQPLAKI